MPARTKLIQGTFYSYFRWNPQPVYWDFSSVCLQVTSLVRKMSVFTN